jgi:ribonuclease R
MDDNQLEQAILELVSQPGYQAIKPRAIARRLQLDAEQAKAVKQAVKRLVRQRVLAYDSGHRVRMASTGDRQRGCVVGIFQRTAKGYGFVRPRNGAPGIPDEDIYIPARKTADAATGDLVLVKLGRGGKHEPGPRGQIVEILERQTNRFVGTYFEAGGAAYVRVDGTVFAQPVYVGDPGAKNVQPDDKVVIEMIRFPSPTCDGEGVIVEVLGPRGKPGVDTLSVIRQFDLPESFAPDALEEARAEAARFRESVADDRLDLTAETIITIDPIDARDFDDAISLVQTENGNWRLGVHIADVAYFVRPNSALDREARNRATSVYLPDRVIPMLPELISNGLASLQPGKLRYAKSVIMDFTPEGIPLAAEIRSSVIRSTKRLTYEQVDQFLADPQTQRKQLGAKVAALLRRMHTLAMTLRRRRMELGALELTMPEVKIDLDGSGRVIGAHVVPYTESHQIIEEFMLAANQAVAQLLHDRGIPFLRRIHQPPAPHKLRALTEFVKELGLQTDDLRSRFALQGLLRSVAGTPHQYAVNYAVLRAMQRAIYGPEEEGHYALASQCYCHFTSPIRRYPDLTVHRLLDAIVNGRKPRCDEEELAALGRHCSQREQRAEAAERDLTKLKLLAYFADRIGEEMDAVITGVEGFGLFVQGVQLPAEGLVHVDSLSDDYYRLDRTTHTLEGFRTGNRFRLGDVVRVAVAHVDLERRELDFRLVQQRQTVRLQHRQSIDRPDGVKLPQQGRPKAKKSVARKTGRRQPARKRKR